VAALTVSSPLVRLRSMALGLLLRTPRTRQPWVGWVLAVMPF